MRRRALGISQASGAVALVLGLTAACGSTVSPQASNGRREGPLPGSADQVAGRVPATSSATDGAPVVLTPAAGSPGHGTDVPAVNGASQGRRVTPPAGADGPGVTDSTITFGVTYATDSGQANEAAGAAGTDPGDVRDYYNALVDEVNRTGGVAGRKLVPAYFETQTTSSESADSQRQAACDYWTNDVKVFVNLDATSEVARSCAEKNGMLSFSGGGNAVRRTFRVYPHYFEPSGIALEDYFGATVSGLAATDYYGKAPVIGIVTWDDPNYRAAVRAGMVPELAKRGLKPKVVSYVRVPQTYAGASESGSAISSAVLRFRQDGVTHAFVMDGPAGVCLGSCITLLWLKTAGSQGYYPRYGLNDLNSPQAGIDAGLWTANDLRGARVVTASNYDDKTDVGVAKNRARIACLALMRRHGLSPGNVNAQAFMIQACDRIWFLRAVLGTARITVNRDVFVALAERLGSTYRSPTTYRTVISATQHDGIAGFRRQAMDDGCDCFTYISGIYPR